MDTLPSSPIYLYEPSPDGMYNRLLELHDCEATQEARLYSLTMYSLEKAASVGYRALSHTWGSGVWACGISCVGGRLLVAANIHVYLRASHALELPHTSAKRSVYERHEAQSKRRTWIDTVCVN